MRSSIHPLLFAGVYKVATHVADLLQANPSMRSFILLTAPRVMQAGLAAMGDFYTYRLACKIYNCRHSASLATLALTVFSPWQWFCSTRTLSNSAETTLTIMALDLWPWDYFLGSTASLQILDQTVQSQTPPISKPKAESRQQEDHAQHNSTQNTLYGSLICAAIACILRPTNVMVWATISISLLLQSGNMQRLMSFITAAILCGSAVLAMSISVDRAYYGEFVFPPLRFLYFNVVQSLAVFYGKNRPDYYLSEGLPLLLTTAMPFATFGIGRALTAGMPSSSFVPDRECHILYILALACITSVTVLSVISHKEVRFIYPLLPMLHVLAGKPLAMFFNPFPWPTKKCRSALLLIGLAVNLLIAGYTCYVHQRGVLDVIDYIRHEYETKLPERSTGEVGASPGLDMTVGFFMPCHSTPWRSHLVHSGIKAWALTCEPPLNLTISEREGYLDEADIFYDDPVGWIKQNMRDVEAISVDTYSRRIEANGRRPWPQYLVFFEQLKPTLSRTLQDSRYQECWRGFNTHWHDDWRRQGDVIVWCLDAKGYRHEQSSM